jgi:hypothetical protein
MGVARQIGEHRFGSCEGALGIDDPLTLMERREPVGEGLGVEQIDVLAEELQVPVPMSVLELARKISVTSKAGRCTGLYGAGPGSKGPITWRKISVPT